MAEQGQELDSMAVPLPKGSEESFLPYITPSSQDISWWIAGGKDAFKEVG